MHFKDGNEHLGYDLIECVTKLTHADELLLDVTETIHNRVNIALFVMNLVINMARPRQHS